MNPWCVAVDTVSLLPTGQIWKPEPSSVTKPSVRMKGRDGFYCKKHSAKAAWIVLHANPKDKSFIKRLNLASATSVIHVSGIWSSAKCKIRHTSKYMEMGKASGQKCTANFRADQSQRSVSFNVKFPPVDEASEDKINTATCSDCLLRGIWNNMWC